MTSEPTEQTTTGMNFDSELPYEADGGSCGFRLVPSENPQADFEGTWECPHPAHSESENCVFHMTEDTRSRLDIGSKTISESIHWAISQTDDGSKNEFLGSRIPDLSLSYEQINGNNNMKINFKYSNVGNISLTSTQIHHGLDFSYSKIGGIYGENSVFNSDFVIKDSNIEGDVYLRECNVNQDVDFSKTYFNGEVLFEENELKDECGFSDCVFEKQTSFHATTFSGISHELGDIADFSNSDFKSKANFKHSNFKCADFSGCSFAEDAIFTGTTATEQFKISDCTVQGEIKLKNAVFHSSVDMSQCVFSGVAEFSGVEFRGKTQAAQSDTNFKGTTFGGEIILEQADVSELSFENCVFKEQANLRRCEFDGHNVFKDATFNGAADFSECLFYGDVEFIGCKFNMDSKFSGAEFTGNSNQMMYNCVFDEAKFNAKADFEGCIFNRASFSRTCFSSVFNLRNSTFNKHVDLEFSDIEDGAIVDLTYSSIYGGEILQKSGSVVPYDLTDATLGDVKIRGETDQYELLDYFRFIETDFDGFDWFEHHDYLERNKWTIHTFEGPSNYNPEEAATPRAIQDTYLKAQTNARQIGDTDAALKFDKKRNRYSRKTLITLMTDSTEPITLRTRIDKFISAIVNWVMDITCGYGSEPGRVALLTFSLPLIYGVLYSLGGPLETSAGSILSTSENQLSILYNNIYYSYISFTTIGYGGIGPVGWLAKILAATQGMLNGILFALLIYTLNKQIDN